MYTRFEQSFTLIQKIELAARQWTTFFEILMDANSAPFLPSAMKKASTSVTANSNPSGAATFNNHCLAESILICLNKIQLHVPLNTVMSILPSMIGAHSISMPSQQHKDWNSFIIWARCSTSFASQPICASNVCVKMSSDDGHELNSQLLPEQGCLDLQMPEKLDPIFEYRQTQPPFLTVKQECNIAHAHTTIIESDCFH